MNVHRQISDIFCIKYGMSIIKYIVIVLIAPNRAAKIFIKY